MDLATKSPPWPTSPALVAEVTARAWFCCLADGRPPDEYAREVIVGREGLHVLLPQPAQAELLERRLAGRAPPHPSGPTPRVYRGGRPGMFPPAGKTQPERLMRR